MDNEYGSKTFSILVSPGANGTWMAQIVTEYVDMHRPVFFSFSAVGALEGSLPTFVCRSLLGR